MHTTVVIVDTEIATVAGRFDTRPFAPDVADHGVANLAGAAHDLLEVTVETAAPFARESASEAMAPSL
jgi:hypothetical protein